MRAGGGIAARMPERKSYKERELLGATVESLNLGLILICTCMG